MAHAPPHVVAFGLVGRSPALVATISQYLFAPLTPPQLKLGFDETPVAPLDGVDKLGAASGGAPAVVNDHCAE